MRVPNLALKQVVKALRTQQRLRDSTFLTPPKTPRRTSSAVTAVVTSNGERAQAPVSDEEHHAGIEMEEEVFLERAELEQLFPTGCSCPLMMSRFAPSSAREVAEHDGDRSRAFFPMIDPVVSADGQSYERLAIEAWFAAGETTSPVTGRPLPCQQLLPNHSLRSVIKDLLRHVGRRQARELEALRDQEMAHLHCELVTRKRDPELAGETAVQKSARKEQSSSMSLAQREAFLQRATANALLVSKPVLPRWSLVPRKTTTTTPMYSTEEAIFKDHANGEFSPTLRSTAQTSTCRAERALNLVKFGVAAGVGDGADEAGSPDEEPVRGSSCQASTVVAKTRERRRREGKICDLRRGSKSS